MPIERIDQYKRSAKLTFSDEEMEIDFNRFQAKRGRSTSIYALSALSVLNLCFAFLEHWILGLNSVVPMIAYLVVGGICLMGAAFSLMSHSLAAIQLRILVPGVMTLAILLMAVYLQQYRIYHAIELALLVIWLASLNILRFRMALLFSLMGYGVFTTVAILSGASDLKLHGLLAIELSSFALAIYLAYLLERFRRMLYLTNSVLHNVYSRQESWAFTLIDLDMALSGIRDFKEITARLVEYMKQVVDYDSYVFTSLEGKGPKPVPDQMEGTLFEQEDMTLWSDDLMTKLSQTRHAVTSAQFDEAKGFMGRTRKNFLHFRLDIPLFNDSSLVGVISLRRQTQAYDDLDMTASVSMASQAMMIFRQTQKASQMSDTLLKNAAEQAKQIQAEQAKSKPAPAKPQAAPVKPEATETDTTTPTDYVPNAATDPDPSDIDITQDQTQNGAAFSQSMGKDETVVPHAVIEKIRKDTESARKTITLLSRENADKIAVDKYRTAAVEGEPLSILLIEVDGLSTIRENDSDQAAYRVFAGIVKHIFAATESEKDVLGRYGQNGISVLLPKVDMNAAEKLGEALRKFAESSLFKTPYGERKATLSIGVAAITDETGNYDSMVKRADMALFVAKKNGRNCVKVRL